MHPCCIRAPKTTHGVREQLPTCACLHQEQHLIDWKWFCNFLERNSTMRDNSLAHRHSRSGHLFYRVFVFLRGHSGSRFIEQGLLKLDRLHWRVSWEGWCESDDSVLEIVAAVQDAYGGTWWSQWYNQFKMWKILIQKDCEKRWQHSAFRKMTFMFRWK